MVKHIYLIAGEASGDFLGAQLMKALKARDPDIKFSGIGGPQMQAQGLKSLFPMNELSLMGLVEILPKIFKLLGRIDQTVDDIAVKRPDIVVTIDAPDFSFRVLKKVRKKVVIAPKLIHYVAPTVWAWRPKRALKISEFLDGLICLFDFEPDYFTPLGLPAIAVGHPVVESGLMEAKPALIGDDAHLKIGVFLGSRESEIKRIAPVIIKALKKVKARQGNIELILPTLPHLEEQVKALVLPLNLMHTISTDPNHKWSVFKACDIAIAVSGTVGLELAVANIPHLIAYRMNGLTASIGRRLIKTPYAHLANIIRRQMVVPEFIQEDCRAGKIAEETLKLLGDEKARERQKREFEEVRAAIGAGTHPSQKAADYLLSL
jgi:lipid-A-disaccharide synthase